MHRWILVFLILITSYSVLLNAKPNRKSLDNPKLNNNNNNNISGAWSSGPYTYHITQNSKGNELSVISDCRSMKGVGYIKKINNICVVILYWTFVDGDDSIIISRYILWNKNNLFGEWGLDDECTIINDDLVGIIFSDDQMKKIK